MFKPLLRTLPSLTGNFSLACHLTNYIHDNSRHHKAYVRNASLIPLQNELYDKEINISLFLNRYEYDVKDFYKWYSSVFYEENYSYDKNFLTKFDITNNNKSRNINYEFGCKRFISSSTGYQYMFFAPIYIDNYESIPDEFEIKIKFFDNVTKTIHINISDDKDQDKNDNALKIYLKKYLEQIDNTVVFCLPNEKQGAYYGINVKYGGFTRVKDNIIGKIFTDQMTLNDYDDTICQGFKRNELIMRQIIPMSFLFNIDDILTDKEKEKYKYKTANISGKYIKNGMTVDFFDFSSNYDMFKINGKNIMSNNNGSIYFSLNETNNDDVCYDNKISQMYCRWKLRDSSDKDPYITNSSLVYGENKYKDFPSLYYINSSYIWFDDDKKIHIYNDTKDDISKFFTETKYDISEINIETNGWTDVYGDKVYHNGVMYDVKNIMLSYNPNMHYADIDKFGVFAKLNFKDTSETFLSQLNIDDIRRDYFNFQEDVHDYELYRIISQVSRNSNISYNNIYTQRTSLDGVYKSYTWSDTEDDNVKYIDYSDKYTYTAKYKIIDINADSYNLSYFYSFRNIPLSTEEILNNVNILIDNSYNNQNSFWYSKNDETIKRSLSDLKTNSDNMHDDIEYSLFVRNMYETAYNDDTVDNRYMFMPKYINNLNDAKISNTMVRIDEYDDIYVDYYSLNNYFKLIQGHTPSFTKKYAYMKYVDEEQFKYYNKRMYNGDQTYKGTTYFNITESNIGCDVNFCVDMKKYTGNVYEENLYHKSYAVKLDDELYDILKNEKHPLMLYITDKKFNKRNTKVMYKNNMTTNDNIVLYPLIDEYKYGNDVFDKIHDLNLSRNIHKVNGRYVYNKYDMLCCRQYKTSDLTEETIDKYDLYIKDDPISIDISGPNVIDINGKNHLFYYINIDIYPNEYSLSIKSKLELNKEQLKRLSLKDLLPVIKANLFNSYFRKKINKFIINEVPISIKKRYERNSDDNTFYRVESKQKYDMKRYYDNIIPLTNVINERNISYELLYKNTNDTIERKYTFIDIDDKSIYKYNGLKYVDNGNIESINEFEYKFFNDNNLYMLEQLIELSFNVRITYDELLRREEEEYVLNNVFGKYIEQYYNKHNISLSQDEKIFLFNRYKWKVSSDPMTLNATHDTKLYKMKYTFTLI